MKKRYECQTSAISCLILIFATLLPLVAFAQPISYKIAVVGRSDFNTVRDDLDELMAKGKISGYDLYTESNIEDLWSRLNEYQILIIDEDCMFDWFNPGPDYNKPIPVLPIGVSFYNHKNELKQWIYNGGRLFSTDQNDISYDVPVSQPWTDEGNVWWTWLPDDLQVESNEFPSNYPEIGYGHDPWNLEVIYDPGIFSYPNKIDVTKVSKYEAHGRFTKYPGYTALVRDKSNGDILEVYRSYGAGVVVLSHLEYETADPWDVNYIENELYFISPQRKDIGLTLYIEDAVKGEDELAAPLVNKAPGDKIDIISVVSNREKDPYDIDVVFEVPADLSFEKAFTRDNFLDIDERAITPTISGNKYTVTLRLEGGKSKQIVLRFTISTSASTNICPIIYARAIVEGTVCSSATTMYNMVNNVKAMIVTNRHLIIQRYGLDERIDKALNWAFSQLGSTKYKDECLSFVEDAYAEAGSDPRNNIPVPGDPGFRYAKYVAEFLNAKIGTYIPPRGAWMFYDWTGWVDLNKNGVKESGEIRNWGHVGISLGDGHVIHALGKVQINSIQEMEEITIQGEKLKYVGWAWPPLTPPIGYSFSKELLSYLYKISDWREENCIIYYVDHYDETLKKWDQNVDYTNETTANRYSTKIDDLIEEWAEKLAQKEYFGPNLISVKYPYLLIIGGDEVIPFYRNRNPSGEYHYNSKDPVLNTYDHDYYLTDAMYADLDDKNWEQGSINLAVGRITGYSTGDMKKLIQNGLKSPARSDNAVLASYSGNDLDFAERIKDLKKINILNDDEKPRTIESDKWAIDDLIAAMKKGFCIFAFGGHANYYVIESPEGRLESFEQLAKDKDLILTIEKYRPYITTEGCYSGVITDNDSFWNPEPTDNLAWAFIHDGASGYLGTTTYSWANVLYGVLAYGEKLFNNYYNLLITKKGKTNPIGDALRDAIIKYDAGLWWNGFWEDYADTAAVTEFHIYGIPWMVIDPESSAEQIQAKEDFVIKVSSPQYVSPDTFKRTIEINVTNYKISKIDGFDIIEINGTDKLSENNCPILPKVDVSISLPKASEILSLYMNYSLTERIGYYNIPSFNYTSGSLETSPLIDFYPSPNYLYRTADFNDHKEAIVSLALVTYNPRTNETILNKYTRLELLYKTPIIVAITNFSLEKTNYLTGEPINASITVENVGSKEISGLYANLQIEDIHGRVVASTSSAPFNLALGETKEVSVLLEQQLPHGTYLLSVKITGSGTLAASSKYIKIISGGIVDFSAPSEVKSGDDITFEVYFMNAKMVDVLGESVIYIYDSHGIEIAELHSLPTTFPAISTTQIKITWSTVGREYGTYTASAMVYAGGESFGPSYQTFEITPPDDIPPITTLEINEPKYVDLTGNIYVSSVTPFTLTAEDNPGGAGVASSFYRIYNNTYDTGWVEYSGPFYLIGLSDGKYTIDYYSIDNAGNIEPTNTATVILFSWQYIYEDTQRGTTLKINANHKFFQFITMDGDYGIRQASRMYESYVTLYYNEEYISLPAIIIRHKDSELLINAYAGTSVQFCYATARDLQTGKRYRIIIDPPEEVAA